MPIDYQQIYLKIKEIGQGARERSEKKAAAQDAARDLLGVYATQLDVLRAKVETAKATDPNIRCALPVNESLVSSHPPPASVIQSTLIAADGSQINPDRHAAVQFGVVNVGAIIMKMNSGEAPVISTDTDLLYGDDLLPNGIPMSEGLVALKRDLAERSQLEELSRGMTGSIVTFTDGPIELWGAKGEDVHSYMEYVEKYLGVLSRLQSRGVITAGYVDKPSADLVVRLLEIASADAEQIKKMKDFHPLLPPAHRSAVFKIQSSSEKKYSGVLELHFFYLNVGTDANPWPVRVEIPRWVLDDKSKLDLLHGVLVEQCRMMGSKPYPYLLHRAHETAVVKNDEKQQIEQMLQHEMRRNDEEMDNASHKSSAKALRGRTRRI